MIFQSTIVAAAMLAAHTAAAEDHSARRILEESRRRFGESFRPQLELDYIERLLRDF